MKYSMNRLFAAVALLACFACSKTETDINNVMNDELGDFIRIAPIVEDDVPETRGYKTADWAYHFEVGDRIAIWDDLNDVMRFKVAEVYDNGRAKIDGGKFHLEDGETYWSTYPYVSSNADLDRDAQVYTYEGQTQTDQNLTNGKLTELAKFSYNWASATRENGSSSFNFERLSTFFRVVATLPEAGMTIKEIAVTADKDVFDLNGTFDLTTGTLIPDGNYTNTIKMTLNNLTVSGNIITAYFASNPLMEAADYVISITDSNDKVYVSPAVHKEVRLAGKATAFTVTVESEEKEYVKVTSIDSDATGKYILVYPNGTTYRTFSFTKAMENAEAAGELAKDTHGLENILAMGSQLYATVVANNCIDVVGPANAESLVLTPDQEKEAAFEVSLLDADHAWDLVDGKVTLSATTQKGNSYSIGIDHAVVNVNGNADVVVAFNAPDVINAMKAIRGTDLPVDFDYLINLAVAQAMKEGITFTPAQIARLKSGFEHLCVLAKSMVASHPEVFQGGTLMDINLSTNVFDVVGRYYDNATQMSWAIAPQKRFGLATLGYHAYDKGFTFNVGLPQAGWFNRLEESLKYDADNDGVLEAEDCVAYWKQFDSQYNLGIPNFFERASRRALSELDSTTLLMLQQMAAGGKFAAIGNVYKRYADRFNDELEPVYIYKKVE